MANKKNQEIKELSVTDIANSLIETRMELQKSLFTHSVKGLDNPMHLKKMKKRIARLKTEERAREIVAMTEEQKAGRSKIRARRSK